MHHMVCKAGLLVSLWWMGIIGAGASDRQSYSPAVDRNYPSQLYWGDTHLHTNLSVDAYTLGNRALSPADAYRLARGETVVAHNGMEVRLSRPLDFLVVADHSENMGVMTALAAGDSALNETNAGKRLQAAMKNGSLQQNPFVYVDIFREGAVAGRKFSGSVWKEVIAAAEQYNEPKRFTAFIGYEWSAPSDLSVNLHRVVIFKDGAERAGRVIPFSSFDSAKPEDLWAYLADYEHRTGGEVLAIPHNGNLSKGRMFRTHNENGELLAAEQAKTRSRWEPLYEVTQTKGDAETHPGLSPEDEFSDFEHYYADYARAEAAKAAGGEHKLWSREPEYARSALKLGLTLQEALGVNPFKFGMIGGTDSHTSLSAVDEDNFWGKVSILEPGPTRLRADAPSIPEQVKPLLWRFSASGYAAVWAEENTRESIFAALKRKEVYASSGPRIAVRFFGGWSFTPQDAAARDPAVIGYGQGVPMGGDLTHAPAGRAPTFLLRAVKDPGGANLDRAQVVKGWLDEQGKTHERVYDAALSGGRKVRADGKAPPVGSTVDLKTASFTNAIGAAELSTVWVDPHFNAKEPAFYYARVLEIPTPRWTAYDVKFFALERPPGDMPMVIQERAVSSPIWYTPR
jgi:hypothetical protein